jgi:hypothetical protein
MQNVQTPGSRPGSRAYGLYLGLITLLVAVIALGYIGSFGQGYQRDLANPRRWQTLDDQPIVFFGGPLLNAYERTWPPPPQAILRQLTRGGCCVRPFFSPDSSMVLFIDKPAEDAPVGVYGLDLTTFESPAIHQPELVYEIIGFRSPDHQLVALPDADDGRLMRFVNEATGESWTVNTLGNWPIFSAGGEQILWNVTERSGPYDERPTDIWVSNLDGSEARRLLTIYGGAPTAGSRMESVFY